MTDQTTKETCPTCSEGVLISAEVLPDGFTKHFSCGHTHQSRKLEEQRSSHDSLGFKAKSGGRGKPYIEGKSGEDLHRKTGKWMLLDRVIDRARNWYKERITDPETGRVVHHCEEPLNQHRGHGSAQKKTKN